jgi:hypothetical protein
MEKRILKIYRRDSEMKNIVLSKNIVKIFFLLMTFFFVTSDYGQNILLDGEWLLAKDQYNTINISSIDTVKNWRAAKVPYSWHLLYGDLIDYQGIVWYKKSVDINKKEENKRYILHFGAVDYSSKLYVNRKFVGRHEGGYTPFDFDITQFIEKGGNEIMLRVMDPVADSIGTEGISYWNIPHGKQSWYVQNSGIWQSVFISVKPEKFVSRAKINTKINGEFSAEIFIDGSYGTLKNQSIVYSVYSPENVKVYESKSAVGEVYSVMINGKIDSPEIWDTENPNLYTLKIKYGVEEFTERFGFREFTSREGKFYLNDKPFYMIAALDQNFYPETVYKIPSEEYLRDEMTKAKLLGLNTLRCHIKVPEPEYLKVADELGLLVWYEIPNWDVFNESVKARSRFTINKMLERDWNHPSLVVVSIINESWGIDLSKPDQREWLKNEFDYVKNLATGRLVVDNSACWGNFHLKTDINDYHTYYAIPENHKKFSSTIQDVASRPKWLFSNHGDSQETGKEVLMISEFGNWGLPKLPDKIPFWFNRKFGDAKEVLPEGVQKRFSDFKYGRMFESYDKLAEESQKAEFTALKYEIEEIRLQNPIQGYVITEFTDINWECNGLLDMWRNVKENHKELSNIQQPDVIIPRADKYNYWDNETVSLKIYLSHYSSQNLSGSKIIWSVSNNHNGEVEVSEIGEASVKEITGLKLSIGKIDNPQKLTVNFELVNADKKKIAKNFTEVFVYPQKSVNEKAKVSVDDKNELMKTLSSKLVKNGFQISEDKDAVMIVNSIDERVMEKMKAGTNVICLADGNTKNISGFPLEIISRDSAGLDGNWASNLNWIEDSSPLFNKIVFEKKLGFEAVNAIPNYVIGSIPAEIYDDVLSGMFIGWVHANSAHLVQMRIGNANLILTTFKLAENYGADPYSTIMLENIIDYIRGKECNPKLKWD